MLCPKVKCLYTVGEAKVLICLTHRNTRHGKIVSTIRKLPPGCKLKLLQNVFHRQVSTIWSECDEELNLAFNVKAVIFSVFVSLSLKC